MREWLKFTGLAFFSDKIAKQAAKRGYVNALLGFILSLVFMFCGIIAADILPFPVHYKSAEDFREFLYNAFADGEKSIGLEINGGILSADLKGGIVVDTKSDEKAAEAYGLNGYDLVVDARSADAFDDFYAYCELKDGTKVPYDEFIKRGDAENLSYDFKIEYSGKELVLTDELTKKHEEYLGGEGISEEIAKQFSELKNKKGELSEKEYADGVYTLYVKAYYPSLTAYERMGGVPLLRNYYYHNYVTEENDKYFFVFSDICIGSFQTKTGMTVQFYGYFDGLQNGAVRADKSGVDKFVKDVFSATAGVSVVVYIMNIIRLVPYILLMPAVIALIAFCVLKLMKAEWCKRFGTCIKIVGSYLIYSSLITVVLTFICGYFVPRNYIYMTALLIYFAVIFARVAALLIAEKIAISKNPPQEDEADKSILSGDTENDTLRG